MKNVVEDSVGVRVLSVTKHKTFMCFRCKFRIVMRISNPTFSTEDFEITHIGFLVSEEFIGSLLEEFVKIYSVDDVARSINWLLTNMKCRKSSNDFPRGLQPTLV